MAETMHTPGDWKWERPRSTYKHLVGAGGVYVLSSEEYAGSSWIEIENEADARLIEAAPDLLQALRNIVGAIEFTPLGVRALKALEDSRAAISKATQS